jgi:hypothetical protein
MELRHAKCCLYCIHGDRAPWSEYGNDIHCDLIARNEYNMYDSFEATDVCEEYEDG